MDVMTENKVVPKLRFGEFKVEWKLSRLKDVSLKITDGTHDTPKTTEVGMPYLTAIHIKDGVIDYDNCKYLSNADHNKIYKRCNPEKGDLLLVNIGAGTATCAINIVDYEFSLKNVALIKPNRKLINENFLEQVQREERKKLFHRLTSGGAQPFLSLKEIGKIKLILPSISEQQKIASFLSAVDEKLQQLTKKKELLSAYKKGVMQKIFSQELRFKDEFGNSFPDWEEKKLGEELEHKSIRNKSNQVDLVLSVSNKKGFISQQEQFDGHQVASKDVTNYKVVNKGDYAYNPSRINVGSIARLDDFQKGIVSPMYVIFRLKNNLNPIFFDALLSSHRFKHLIKIGCSGSVRDSLNFDEMENFDVKLPCIDEQQKIANFLSLIDKKIELISSQIENTKAFKKGLLQQMFV